MSTARNPKLALADMVASAVALQDQVRATRGRYEVLGQLYAIECEAGSVHFNYRGPGVAQEVDANGKPTGLLLFISPWADLPQVPEHSEEFCPTCLAKCDVCAGTGKAGCIYTGCGGRGTVQQGELPCPDCVVKSATIDPKCRGCGGKGVFVRGEAPAPCAACINATGKFNPACVTCGGHGAVPNLMPCPACHATGKAPCSACRGLGERPTGKNNRRARSVLKGRSIFALSAHELSGVELCASCHGTQRAGKWKPQDLSKLITGRIANYAVIGPVGRLLITQAPATNATKPARWDTSEQKTQSGAFLRITPQRDRAGQPMLVLLPLVSQGAPPMPYFYGGTVG